ncbi:Rab small monomeric gtpase [Mycena sanguinolenta]|uniref:Rab small monomeric gtpase n=1 Tax=Mycena sanguinolenta TaxID=230812 RepID=A0A8H6ZIV8_9AGAR|nr:Rab small monomeric gtpase [Mycena sanguinolenta]
MHPHLVLRSIVLRLRLYLMHKLKTAQTPTTPATTQTAQLEPVPQLRSLEERVRGDDHACAHVLCVAFVPLLLGFTFLLKPLSESAADVANISGCERHRKEWKANAVSARTQHLPSEQQRVQFRRDKSCVHRRFGGGQDEFIVVTLFFAIYRCWLAAVHLRTLLSLVPRYHPRRFHHQDSPCAALLFLSLSLFLVFVFTHLRAYRAADLGHSWRAHCLAHLWPVFVRGADAAILMYDLTSSETLYALREWWDEFKAKAAAREEDLEGRRRPFQLCLR